MTRRGPRSPVPIYQQIVNAIKADIDAGRLRPGQQLPKEPELMRTHRTARITVRRALHILREEGLVYTVHGEGSYVGPEDAPKIRELRPYEQAAADLVTRIKAGEYKTDEVLPSETEMMEAYGIAKNTARSAIGLLREQGWVYTVPAIGTFVSGSDKWPKEA